MSAHERSGDVSRRRALADGDPARDPSTRQPNASTCRYPERGSTRICCCPSWHCAFETDLRTLVSPFDRYFLSKSPVLFIAQTLPVLPIDMPRTRHHSIHERYASRTVRAALRAPTLPDGCNAIGTRSCPSLKTSRLRVARQPRAAAIGVREKRGRWRYGGRNDIRCHRGCPHHPRIIGIHSAARCRLGTPSRPPRRSRGNGRNVRCA